MNTRIFVSIGILVSAYACNAVPAKADTLLVERVKEERSMNAPRRGLTMAQVEHMYGAPSNKLPTAGGDAPLHPPINRWIYPNYVVYFERNHVINSVAQRATPTEIGVKTTPPESGGSSTPE